MADIASLPLPAAPHLPAHDPALAEWIVTVERAGHAPVITSTPALFAFSINIF